MTNDDVNTRKPTEGVHTKTVYSTVVSDQLHSKVITTTTLDTYVESVYIRKKKRRKQGRHQERGRDL